MKTQDIQQLNEQFSLQGEHNRLVIKSGPGDIPLIEIQNKQASASICLQGAHLLSWLPAGEQEVIWLSEEAIFKTGKSIRGGIPVCWPWFGAHQQNTEFPAHGFARTSLWDILATEAIDDGVTRIRFSLPMHSDTEAMWLAGTSVEYQLTIGRKLQLEIKTTNNGDRAVALTQALHTYFKVSDVSQVYLHGLDHTDYLDKLENFDRKCQFGPVTIQQEVDRIYVDTFNDCIIEDKLFERDIIIKKVGSHSTVVWNPWQQTAAKMGDLGSEGYQTMLCVESSNAADDTINIEPGNSHQLWVQYDVQRSK